MDRSAAISALKERLGERLSVAEAVRAHHGKDESWHRPMLPDAVAFPEATEEVAEILAICARHRLPVIPFGVGSSYEGQLIPVQGGVSVDMGRMNRILAVHAEDMDAVIEPGVTRKQLNAHLRDTGLFFPIDPGADASLGGMCATRASGTNAVRYGTMREAVLALKVVLPGGEVITTGSRARKSSAGYDLTRLFIGSEGTLGVITEITLRLHGIPEAISSAICTFPGTVEAVRTAIETIQCGVPIARCELLDAVMVRGLNAYSKTSFPEQDLLLLEFHGSHASVREQAQVVAGIAQANGGSDFRWTAAEEERARMWQARHDCAHAAKLMRPGAEAWATDVCVPISRLADCIGETRADVAGSRLVCPILGHVGDGNFHMVFLLNRDDPAEVAEADRLSHRLVERALAMGGTCTGEHGVGLGKRGYMVEEHGSGAVALMRAMKQAVDPLGIMNPGKTLPEPARPLRAAE